MGSTVYAVTLASSVIYMKALIKLLASKVKDNCEMTEKDLKDAVDETMKDKDLIKTVMKEAKAGYAKEKEKKKEEVTA